MRVAWPVAPGLPCGRASWLFLAATVSIVVFPLTQSHPVLALDGPPAVLGSQQTRALKPKDSFRECADCPDMVVVPAGSFTMGYAGEDPNHGNKAAPVHTVTFAKPFAVGKYPVTVAEFAAFVKEAGSPPGGATCQNFSQYIPDPPPAVRDGPSEFSWHAMGYKQTDRFPVGCISWNDANAYAGWLARKTGRPYRLLSEAEFEYATRSRTVPGTYPPFFFGADAKQMCKFGNSADAALAAELRRQKLDPKSQGPEAILDCNDGFAFAAPVGSFRPNAFGLYDMLGNVDQWTADCVHETYEGAPSDGRAWIARECDDRIVRGGSWNETARTFGDGTRGSLPAEQNNPELGFRVARTLE